jgi:hypothetical protein
MKQASSRDPEDGGDMFSKMLVGFHQTIRHHIPGERTLHSHCCESLESNTECSYCSGKFMTKTT